MSEDAVKVREVYSILTQGIQVTEYKVHRGSRKSTVIGRILWMDADIFRICIDATRPSISDRIKGKIPPGVYLRDVSEVRIGADCFHFSRNRVPPQDGEHCLALIGSEGTVAIEFPSKFTRDWFFERFQLLVDDISMEVERKTRRFKVTTTYRVGQAQTASANAMKTALTKGIQVMSHRRDGQILPSALVFDADAKHLVLRTPVRSYLNMVSIEEKRIDLFDVAELRPGCHSLGFVKTKSTSLHGKALTIVSSEWVFDLEMVSEEARDLMAEKLFNFVMFVRLRVAAQATAATAPRLQSGGVGKDFSRALVRAQDVEVRLDA